MKNNITKKTVIALLVAAMLSSCAMVEDVPTIGSDAPISSIESSSIPEESFEEEVPVVIEPVEEEPLEEPEPIPEPVVYISSTEVEPGDYIILRAENLDLKDYTFVDFLDYHREFIAKDGGWYCFIPVKTAADPGSYKLEFSVGDFTYSETVKVLERKAPKQYLVVAPSTLEQTLEDDAVRAAFNEFYQEYRWYETGIRFWEDDFMMPLGDSWYNETTKFGTFRTFSNGDTEWHNAVDMAVGGGTPIYATNSGVILFADYLGLTGYTIVINHGMGVLSWHYHLSSMKVETGDAVEKGDFIGRVGTTGLSTGNHLHFAISVGGIFVDPLDVTENGIDLEFWKVTEE
ncbi:MAG: M23 family metallopeptidase [Oscillospiraceae bacterium]|nr:M23 family metallopeptidase [Oscillospiraceae bacterium]